MEYFIHRLSFCFNEYNNDALLLIDAKNALKHLKRNLAIHNISNQCLSLTNAMSNSYQAPSKLFVEKETFLSQEGTTQGNPHAMSMYGIATLLLISCVQTGSIIQKWCADIGSSAGKITELRDFFD